MSTSPQFENLALYAMDLLDDAERSAVEAQLEVSAAAREELALIRGDLAAFALTAEMHSPPALARQRLLKQISRERKPVAFRQPAEAARPTAAQPPTASPFAGYAAQASVFAKRLPDEYVSQQPSIPPPPRRITRRDSPEEEVVRSGGFAAVVPYVGWALAAGMSFAAFFQYNQRLALQNSLSSMAGDMTHLESQAAQAQAVVETITSPAAQRVTLMQNGTPPAGPCGKAIYVPEKGMLTFIATNLEPLQPYKTYELWLIPADGRDPIPAGTFKPDQTGYASVLMPELPKGIPAKAFGVTIEDDGGAQTPTMPIVLAGAS